MTIVSSVILENSIQRDGRSHITERHLDHLGKEYRVNYLASVGEDINSILAIHANQAWDNAVQREIDNFLLRLVDGTLPDPATLVFNYTTRIDVLKALLRWAVKQTVVEALKAIPIINYVKANYTVTQIANALGVTTTIVNKIYNRFVTLESIIKPLIDTDTTQVMEV